VSLRAPMVVPVEVRLIERAESQDDLAGPGFRGPRWFRLSRNVGEDGVTLQRPIPVEADRPVLIAFQLPDKAGGTMVLRAVVALTDDDGQGEDGGRGLWFGDASVEARDVIGAYVRDRLGLPMRFDSGGLGGGTGDRLG
jgi:hypothetical protein